MPFREWIRTVEQGAASVLFRSGVREGMPVGRAKLRVEHMRPSHFLRDLRNYTTDGHGAFILRAFGDAALNF